MIDRQALGMERSLRIIRHMGTLVTLALLPLGSPTAVLAEVTLQPIGKTGAFAVLDDKARIGCVSSVKSKGMPEITALGTPNGVALAISPSGLWTTFPPDASSNAQLTVGKYNKSSLVESATTWNAVIFQFKTISDAADMPEGPASLKATVGGKELTFKFSTKGIRAALKAIKECTSIAKSRNYDPGYYTWRDLWNAYAALHLGKSAHKRELARSLSNYSQIISADFDQSIRLYRELSNKWDLAELLINIGGKANIDEARRLISTVEDFRGGQSQLLGLADEKTGQAGAAIEKYEIAAKAGSGTALIAATRLLAKGYGGSAPDVDRAARLIREAAQIERPIPAASLATAAATILSSVTSTEMSDEVLSSRPNWDGQKEILAHALLSNPKLPSNYRASTASKLAEGQFYAALSVAAQLWFGTPTLVGDRRLASALIASTKPETPGQSLVLAEVIMALTSASAAKDTQLLPPKQEQIDRLREIAASKSNLSPLAMRMLAYEMAESELEKGAKDQAAARLSRYVDANLQLPISGVSSLSPAALLSHVALENGKNGWSDNAYEVLRTNSILREGRVAPPRALMIASADGTLAAHIEAVRCGQLYGVMLTCRALGSRESADDMRLLIVSGQARRDPSFTMLNAFNSGVSASINGAADCNLLSTQKSEALDGLKACSRTIDYRKLQMRNAVP